MNVARKVFYKLHWREQCGPEETFLGNEQTAFKDKVVLKHLSEISRGEGGLKQGEGHNFFRLRKGMGHEEMALKRGKVMQIYARDHVEVHPQKKKEVLYLVKKTKQNKTKEQRNIMDINCEVLLQEFNKHLLFIYNNAIESLHFYYE